MESVGDIPEPLDAFPSHRVHDSDRGYPDRIIRGDANGA